MRRGLNKPSSRSTRRFLPALEALESRWCPSGAGIVQSGHGLVVQGDGANDTISVLDNGQGGVSAKIILASGTKTFSGTGINSIEIDAGGGSDSISYALTGALSQPETLMLCLGKGNSQATLDYSAGMTNAALALSIGGGAGSNQVTTRFGALTGSRVNLTESLAAGPAIAHVNFGGKVSSSLVTVNVNGGVGADQVFAQLAADVSNSNIQFLTHLGKGANLFDLEAAGNLQNSVVHFDIDTGASGNSITFNVQGVNVDATSRLNLETCSGAGKDTVTLNYSGQMNGELDMNLQGGQGNDTMKAVLTFAKGSTGRVHAHMLGGSGDDTMTFDVYDNSNPGGKSSLALLDALLVGGKGHNTLSATPNVKVVK